MPIEGPQTGEELRDSREVALALLAVSSGAMETLGDPELDAYLAAPTPLAFWRQHRNIELNALAATTGRAPAELARIEAGVEVGDARLYARLANALRLRSRTWCATRRPRAAAD